jgi:hypothetical protein
MKPKKFSKKLLLNKKTVADLGKKEMKEVYGGIKWTYPISRCLSYMCC